MDDARTRCIGINEGLFREVNERLQEISEDTGHSEWRSLELVCECADGQCVERITMSIDDYEALRAEATTFAVVPGHEVPQVEAVVARRDGYLIVQKRDGLAADVARETDPRG